MVGYLSGERKKKIYSYIRENYGVELDEYFFYEGGNERIYISDLDLLGKKINTKVVNVGIYLGKFQKERFRLSIPGANIVKPVRNYLVLKEESLSSFLFGENLWKEDFEDIERVDLGIFLPVCYNGYFLGSVMYTGKDFMNFVPKGKRISFNKVY